MVRQCCQSSVVTDILVVSWDHSGNQPRDNWELITVATNAIDLNSREVDSKNGSNIVTDVVGFPAQ